MVVSALTFRILHGSRDLAMAFVDTLQNLSFIEETLGQVGRPHSVVDEGADAHRSGAPSSTICVEVGHLDELAAIPGGSTRPCVPGSAVA